MKKSLAIILLAVFVVSFIPSPAQAVPLSSVRFFPCIAEDGTYKLTIRVGGFSVGGAVLDGGLGINGFGYQVRIRQNDDPWIYYFYGKEGLTLKYGKIPEGTKFEVEEGYYLNGSTSLSPALPALPVKGFTSSITLKGTDYPACFKQCDGNPLFKMYVLTRDDSYCILVSDVHPSVESQKALCFPGTDWVATNTPCEGWVCDNDCWDCDYRGFQRFSLKELWPIYMRRLGQ
jgi:hypothetical protein